MYTRVLMRQVSAEPEGPQDGITPLAGFSVQQFVGEREFGVVIRAGDALQMGAEEHARRGPWRVQIILDRGLDGGDGQDCLTQDCRRPPPASGLPSAARPQSADGLEERLVQAEVAEQMAFKALDPQLRQDFILKGRELVAQAYALVQAPKAGEFRLCGCAAAQHLEPALFEFVGRRQRDVFRVDGVHRVHVHHDSDRTCNVLNIIDLTCHYVPVGG